MFPKKISVPDSLWHPQDHEILEMVGALFNVRLSPEEGAPLKMPAVMFRAYANSLGDDSRAKGVQNSLLNSVACVLDSLCVASHLEGLGKGDSDSFLIIPINAAKHVFCGVIRRLASGELSMVVVNRGTAYGPKLPIKDPQTGVVVAFPAMYQDYRFRSDQKLGMLLERLNVSPLHSTEKAYEILAEAADEVAVLWAGNRRQKVMACYSIEPKAALVYAIETCSIQSKAGRAHWQDLKFTPETDRGYLVGTELFQPKNKTVRQGIVDQIKLDFPHLVDDLDAIMAHAQANKVFRKTLRDHSLAEALAGLGPERLSVDTLRQYWPSIVKSREAFNSLFPGGDLTHKDRFREAMYALDFHCFKGDPAERSPNVILWSELEPGNHLPWIHRAFFESSLRAGDLFLGQIMAGDYLGQAGQFRKFSRGINPAMPGYSEEALASTAKIFREAAYPELSVALVFDKDVYQEAIVKLSGLGADLGKFRGFLCKIYDQDSVTAIIRTP